VTLAVLAIFLLIGTFIFSLILTAAVRRMAVKADFVASPAPYRYHSKAVPLGGGIAIFAVVFIVLMAGIAVVKFLLAPGFLDLLGPSVTVHATGFLEKANKLVIVLAGLLVLNLLGLWDDKIGLGPFVKLAVQFAVAVALAVLADIRVELFITNKIITSALSAIWIVLMINAFNFLDNMDGLSAGIAVLVSLILLSAAVASGQVFVGAFAIVFIAALLGFLVYNFPPARIFMGDAGSMVVGCIVAVISLRTTYYHEARSGQWYAVFMPLLVMAVPLYDFISVTLLRISQGKSPFVGDTQHFSHRLKRRGLSESQTVLTLYLATLCTGLGATFLRQVDWGGVILIFLQTIMVLAIIAILEAFPGPRKGGDDDRPFEEL
jgi:UDP-GlcNAc:undecaprenyl-phosphate GlcNAc-1-phosphate transferase